MVLRSLAAIVLCAWPVLALADEDFAPSSEAWNGLEAFVSLALASGHVIEIPQEVDVDALGTEDALVIIHPTGPLPVAELTRFLRAGGRLAIVDDYGTGDRLLGAFQITREPVVPDATALSLRDDPELRIATPTGAHPLTLDVRALGTNHPSALRHAHLEPVFSFSDGQALMLAGAVGAGRLIAISDASVFINDMLRLDGNRRLASNLVSYLADGDADRVVLAVGSTPLRSAMGGSISAPVHSLRSLLKRLSEVALPARLVQLGGWLMAAFGLLVVASQVQRTSPYARMGLFARAPILAGFAGRVAYFRLHSRNLAHPLLAFKVEFEAELLHRLGRGTERVLRDVIGDMEKRGADAQLVSRARDLIQVLDQVAEQDERGVEPPMIPAARFRELVRAGERILADLARLE